MYRIVIKGLLFTAALLSSAVLCLSQQSETKVLEGANSGIDSLFLKQFFQEHPTLSEVYGRTADFYDRHNGKVMWFVNGEPIPQASLLLNVVDNRQEFGLVRSYGLGNLSDSVSQLQAAQQYEPARAKWLDVALTAIYFQFFPRLWNGQIDPHAEEEIEWHVSPPEFSYGAALDSILSGFDRDNPFVDYRKFHSGFFLLKSTLAQFRKIKEDGGWPKISSVKLNKGEKGEEVAQLSQRLILSGDLSLPPSDSVFSTQVEEAVRRFQARHGLRPDGIVGPNTIEALNVPVEDRIRQIIVNMERWRWIEPVTDSRYVTVNIPAFQLHAYANDKVKLTMPVIVGKEASKTVVFNDKIKYIVVNPYWNIPKSIAVDEMLPKVKADPNYLRDRKIEVGVNGSYDNINGDTIRWERVSKDDFSYTFRQTPGVHNELGSIKFIFPNKYSIYLHDTPSRQYFERHDRQLSHGCVRVGEPYRLADFLLKKEDDYTARKIKRMIRRQEEADVWITLSDPIPVYLFYFTVWVDEEGKAHFRDDIYGHDRAMLSRLFKDQDSL